MIRTFFSTQSRKAWIGGIIAAGLTPILQLVAEGGSLSVGTILAALVSGVGTAFGVYQAENAKNPADLAAEQTQMLQAAGAAVTALKRVPVPVQLKPVTDHLLEEATKDFGGQVISGE